MRLTRLPGFKDPVHDAQITFRAVLEAMSRPGRLYPIAAAVQPPAGLHPATAAIALTLFDLDTLIWVPPHLDAEVSHWLRFHTGCPLTPDPAQAQFAVGVDPETLPAFAAFGTGTAETPETSTTLLIQLKALEGGSPLCLTGPGIESRCELSPVGLPPAFFQDWHLNTLAYPQGVDVVLTGREAVVGLPRTTHIQQLVPGSL